MAKKTDKVRTFKCQHCNEYGESHMIKKLDKEVDGKVGYIHIDCYSKFLERKAFLKKEREEKDYLNEVVKNIHGLPELPKWYWQYIQDIRNGTDRYITGWKKRYKKGVPYKVIAGAYEYAKSNIEFARKDKKFKDANAEIKYCLVIAHNSIANSFRASKEKEKAQERQRNSIVNEGECVFEEGIYNEVKRKPKDASSFLE